MKKVLLLYVPVLHRGYRDFLMRHTDAAEVLVFGQEIIDRFDWLKRKDVRALDPQDARNALESFFIFDRIGILNSVEVKKLRLQNVELIFTDDAESREVAKALFEGQKVTFDRVFLRWDKPRVLDEKNAEGFPVTADEVHNLFMRQAISLAERSPDWWLGVGAVLVADEKVFATYNKHLPSDHVTYELGDPRSFFQKGVSVEITHALHCEAAVIAMAARDGVSTLGARLYVTTFPCPFCANMLTQTGISEIYFRSGYSMLEGAELLKRKGIKLYKVEENTEPSK